MPLDLCLDPPQRRRRDRGQLAYLSGLAAEDGVERLYLSKGYRLAARRWRGCSGEIDLIFQGADGVIFVEVKRAASHDLALTRLGPAQIRRIVGASEEYLGNVLNQPFAERQYHLALVDGAGRVAIRSDVFECDTVY
ncbi:YraN family protein [Xinfangfangia pollutisoli]|uniref:YraN family protein n=1 Tax=Xinfangfangia pollutisoli TaxID=2865960 RepID=UPI001CD197DB|nr:YraN family protein [Xinfangfangia pollutisoli]